MADSTLDRLTRFVRQGEAGQTAVNRAIARADLLSMVKVAHDELIAAQRASTATQAALVNARLNFQRAQRRLSDFDFDRLDVEAARAPK